MDDSPINRPANLTPEELQDYIESHHEKDYLLIDVRQPAEQQIKHIAGASFIPLLELESTLYDLPAEKDLIFYCRNGGRSMLAASLAAEAEVTSGRVYNLTGGMMAWFGQTAVEFPNVRIFDGAATLEELLYTAMDLEKGAWRFYRAILEKYPGQAISPTFSRLSNAETAHAKTIYGFWKPLSENPPEFEELFEHLAGELLEGGQTLESALEQMASIDENTCLGLIELAMRIEIAAYDLYRTMAGRTEAPRARSTFLSIAQAEKSHMSALTKALEFCQP